jgi:hypothetical protein
MKPQQSLRDKLFGEQVPLRQKIEEFRERGETSKVGTEYSKPIAQAGGKNAEPKIP